MLRTSSQLLAAFGVIGLGQMGARMAPHILKKADCDTLMVYDANPASVELLKKHPYLQQGSNMSKVKVASSIAEVAKSCSAILTMLPNGSIVREVYTAQIFPNAQKGVTCIDSSTTDPATPQALARQLHAQDTSALFCDAPVSGGVVGAEAGTLSIMVGVSDLSPAATTEDQMAAFARVQSYLQHFAKTVTHCGLVGSGAVCKLCNNLILGQHMVALCEAMILADQYHVDLKTVQNVITTSTGKSWCGDVANPVPGVVAAAPSSNGYAPGFGVQLMLKDIKLAVEAAQAMHLATPGAMNAMKVFEETAKNPEWSGKDFSVIIQNMKKKNLT